MSNEIDKYSSLSKNELVELLNSDLAVERSIAANLLKKYNTSKIITILCERLLVENKLYTKIEICETLKRMGMKSAKIMTSYLGKVGNNQHKNIPQKKFEKKSFPLPRDIIARTLAHMDKNILPLLIKFLENGESKSIKEAIDVIGFICFYSADNKPVTSLLQTYRKYINDEIIKWKIARSLQSFNYPEVIAFLEEILNKEDNDLIRKEAASSLSKIRNKIFMQVPSNLVLSIPT